MKLNNRSDGFEITFDGSTHDVPSGEFEVPEKLGYFILRVGGDRWGKDIISVENSIVKEKIAVTVPEVPVEKVPLEETPAVLEEPVKEKFVKEEPVVKKAVKKAKK